MGEKRYSSKRPGGRLSRLASGFARTGAMMLALICWGGAAHAQMGDDFWFDIGEINRGHTHFEPVKCALRVTSFEQSVRVHIEMPAEPGFTPIVFDLPPVSSKRLFLTATSGSNVSNPDQDLALFWRPENNTSSTSTHMCDISEASRGRYIENLLCWAKSDISNQDPKKHYINRTNKGIRMWAQYRDTVWNIGALMGLMTQRQDKIHEVDVRYKNVGPGNAAEWAQYVQELLEIENWVLRERRDRKYWLDTMWVPEHPDLAKKSQDLISGYVENSTGWNMELVALKGRNALGRHFYVPFQMSNHSSDWRYNNMRARQYHSFNIVATKDKTLVKIKTPRAIFVKETGEKMYGGQRSNGTTGNTNEYYVYFEKAGQTAIIAPYESNQNGGGNNRYQVPLGAGTRLAGSEVVVVEGGDVTVITRDDIVLSTSGNPDNVSDQMVPVELAGYNYTAIFGPATSLPRADEYIFVLGAGPGTASYFLSDGAGGASSFSVAPGQQRTHKMTKQAVSVEVVGDSKVYVYHMSGVYGGGDQRGGALLPAIPASGKCVGSRSVSFARARHERDGYRFYLNLLAWGKEDPAGEYHSAIGGFELQVSNDARGYVAVKDLPNSDPKKAALVRLEAAINRADNWKPVPSSLANSVLENWKYYRCDTDIEGGNGCISSDSRYSYQLVNRRNVFHLGTLNGAGGTDCFYGYFSDYAEVKQAITPSKTDPATGLSAESPGSKISLCMGENVYLETGGNPMYDYSWHEVVVQGAGATEVWQDPPPNLLTPHHRATWFRRPMGQTKLGVQATGICDVKARQTVDVEVGENIVSTMAVEPSVCAPYGGEATVRARVHDMSGVSEIRWKYLDPVTLKYVEENFVPSVNVGGGDFVEQEYKFGYPPELIHGGADPGAPFRREIHVALSNPWCTKLDMANVLVYPAVRTPKLEFQPISLTPCSPREVKLNFEFNELESPPDLKYEWVYPDATRYVRTDSNLPQPEPKYLENPSNTEVTQRAQVTITDRHRVCSSTVEAAIKVLPAVSAQIAWEAPQLCAPMGAKEVKSFTSGATSYKWTLEQRNASGDWEELPGGGSTSSVYNLETLGAGDYRLTLMASDATGQCSDSDVREFTIHPTPEAGKIEVEPLNSDLCSPARFRLKATGFSGATKYEWYRRDAGQNSDWGMGSGDVGTATELVIDQVDVHNNASGVAASKVYLKLVHESGCSAKTPEASLMVYPSPRVSLQTAGANLCPDPNGTATLEITANIVGDSHSKTVRWYLDGHEQSAFENQTTFTQPFTNQSFDQEQVHSVGVEVEFAGGCKASDEMEIKVYPRTGAPVVTIHDVADPSLELYDNERYCGPLNLKFESSVAGQTYKWTFPDGTSQYGKEVSKLVSVSGSSLQPYPVRLEVFNMMCVDQKGESQRTLQIFPEIIPAFRVTALDRCNPARMRIENTSVVGGYRYETGMSDVEVNLDVGSATAGPGGEYTFTQAGEVALKLMMRFRDPPHCAKTAKPYVFTVPEKPDAGLDPSTQLINEGCAPFSLTLKAKNKVDDKNFVEWDMGDGTKFLRTEKKQEVTHTYQNTTGNPKIFRVVLRVGTIGLTECENQPGTSREFEIKVLPEPMPSSTVTAGVCTNPPTSPNPGMRLRIQNLSLNLNEYEWRFQPIGNGGLAHTARQSATMFTPPDVYLVNNRENEPIDYEVWFKASRTWNPPEVTNTLICQKPEIKLDNVTIPPAVVPKVAVDKTFGCSGQKFIFTDNSTGGAISSEWDLDDGTGPKTLTPGQQIEQELHNPNSYDRTFNISVQTQRGSQCPQFSSLSVVVHPEVKAAYEAKILDACARPTRVDFTNLSRGSNDAGVTSTYLWDWGDGTSETQPSFQASTLHEYENPAQNDPHTFHTSLAFSQLHSSSGLTCRAESQYDVTVLPSVQAEIEQDKDEICSGEKVVFMAKGFGGKMLTYTWNCSNGTVYDGQRVEIPIDNRGAAIEDVTVSLTIRNEHACEAVASTTVRVHPEVTAQMSIALKTDRCTPYTVLLQNGSLNATRYTWQRDGVDIPGMVDITSKTDQEYEMVNLLERDVEARIRLLAWNDHGCFASDERTEIVPQMLVNAFDITPNQGCNPVEVAFTNKSKGATEYSWEFGRQGQGDVREPQPRIFYNRNRAADLVERIKLTARNAHGCSREEVKEVTIYALVESQFSPTHREGCSGFEVNFENKQTSPMYSYEWDLGLGVTHQGETPDNPVAYFHPTPNGVDVYETPIRLKTYLTAHPECSQTSDGKITIYPGLTPSFELSDVECSPYNIVTRGEAHGFNPSTMTEEWFQIIKGDTTRIRMGRLGQELEHRVVNPSHEEPLEITILLEASSEHLCRATASHTITLNPQPRAGFITEAQSLCPPVDIQFRSDAVGMDAPAARYEYEFGDGSQKLKTKEKLVAHHFENDSHEVRRYPVTQWAYNAYNCTDQITQPVSINPMVTADFSIAPSDKGCDPFVPNFLNHSVNASAYEWKFTRKSGSVVEDYGGSSREQPQQTFTNNTVGEVLYSVSLKASSQYGCEATKDDVVLTVYATPKASFSLARSDGSAADMKFPEATVQVNNTSKPAAPDWSYNWDWGDGKKESGMHPLTHVYESWGDPDNSFLYTVKLLVENAHCSDETSGTVVIRAPEPEAAFAMDNQEGCPPLTVQFYNKSLYAQEYEWDFDDMTMGSDNTHPEPQHTFDSAGKYHVRLIAKGLGGKNDTVMFVNVHPQPQVEFKIEPEKQELPNSTINALNMSKRAVKYRWNFGDGTTSHEPSPSHTYAEPGVYAISLLAISEYGCADSLRKDPGATIRSVGLIRFPSAIRPDPQSGGSGSRIYPSMTEMNRDVGNQVLHPYLLGSVREYKLSVFNRWGEQVFETTNILEGWDGFWHGRMAPLGVYTWRCIGVYFDGELFDLKGNVTLFH